MHKFIEGVHNNATPMPVFDTFEQSMQKNDWKIFIYFRSRALYTTIQSPAFAISLCDVSHVCYVCYQNNIDNLTQLQKFSPKYIFYVFVDVYPSVIPAIVCIYYKLFYLFSNILYIYYMSIYIVFHYFICTNATTVHRFNFLKYPPWSVLLSFFHFLNSFYSTCMCSTHIIDNKIILIFLN